MRFPAVWLMSGLLACARPAPDGGPVPLPGPVGVDADLLESLVHGMDRSDYGETYEFLRWRAEGPGSPSNIALAEQDRCGRVGGKCLGAVVSPSGEPAGPPACHADIYPFLDTEVATLATFEKRDDPRFAALPATVRKRFESLLADSEAGIRPPGRFRTWTAPVRVPASDFPELAKPWWILTDSGAVRAEPTSVRFLVRPVWGRPQVELEFRHVPPGALLATQEDHLSLTPRKLGLMTLASGARLRLVPVDGERYWYAGPSRIGGGRFDLVWDAFESRLSWLSLSSGVRSEEESLELRQSRLLETEGGRVLFRWSTGYAEGLCLGSGGVGRIELGDRTQPDRGGGSISVL